MSSLVHPDPKDVTLAAALHALADPVRLDIVRRLDTEGEMNCARAMPCDTVPKSTRSNHFRILRAAGMIETRKAGRDYLNRLRRDEVDRRFPGLLDTVLRVADAESAPRGVASGDGVPAARR